MKKDKTLAIAISLILQITLILPFTTQRIFAQGIENTEFIQEEEIDFDDIYLEQQIEDLEYEVIEETEELFEENSIEHDDEQVLIEDVPLAEELPEEEIITLEESIQDSEVDEVTDDTTGNTEEDFEEAKDIIIEEEIKNEETIPEITQIEFSLDSIVFEDSINAVGETEIFFRYDISEPSIEIKSEKAMLADGRRIENPFVLENYINQPITVELTLSNNETITAVSEPLSIFPNLAINEIYSYGSSSWIEIYNPKDVTVQLLDYKLSIEQDEFVINTKTSTKEKSCSSFVELKKGEYCIVYINYVLDNKVISLKASDLIVESLVTSEFDYYSSTILNEGSWVKTFSITLGAKNVFNENETLIITEILPAPDTAKGEYEWIEIYNYGEEDIDLTGWYFNDLSDGKCMDTKVTSKFDRTIIKPGEHAVTGYENNKEMDGISQNDSGDEVYLCNTQNSLIDFLIYTSTVKSKAIGKPYSLSTELYSLVHKILSKVSPNDFNIEPEEIVVVDPAKSVITIAQARQKNENDSVTVKGSAIVEPNLLGDTNLYIQDSTGGIRIDLPTGLQINIIKDQTIQITGKVDLYYSEKEIDVANLNDIKFTDENNLNFQPIQINAGPIYSNLSVSEGSLVYTEGEIINNYSTSFDLQTSSGIIRVSILSSTGIDIPEKSKGDYVKVTGVLSRYNSDYRVLPRYKNDLEIISAIPPISAAKATKTTTAKPKTTATKTTATRSTTTAAKSVAIKSSTSPAEPGLNIISDTSILSATSQSQQVLFPFWILMLIGIITSLIILLLKVWKYYEIGQLVRKLQNKTNSSISKGKGYFEWR